MIELNREKEIIRVEKWTDITCRRRLNIDPPCRSNIDPGRVAGF
jgi:hypothetical protein